jgi:hypothetical protein
VVEDFLAVATDELAAFERGVHRNVQTNEVGRAAVLASGFAHIAGVHGLPIDQLEIGSSAGLLSHWDRFHYDTGDSRLGPVDSAVAFGPRWWSGRTPTLRPVEVIHRRASDIGPIDVLADEGRLTAMSFVWPDQRQRFDRLRAAIDIAAADPLTVEQADAGVWLSRELGDAPRPGRTTVVFHSIVWQYLPTATRDAVRASIRDAGARATAASPLAWLRMEPATRAHADLRLTTYPGGVEQVLALVGYHGADVRWTA